MAGRCSKSVRWHWTFTYTSMLEASSMPQTTGQEPRKHKEYQSAASISTTGIVVQNALRRSDSSAFGLKSIEQKSVIRHAQRLETPSRSGTSWIVIRTREDTCMADSASRDLPLRLRVHIDQPKSPLAKSSIAGMLTCRGKHAVILSIYERECGCLAFALTWLGFTCHFLEASCDERRNGWGSVRPARASPLCCACSHALAAN